MLVFTYTVCNMIKYNKNFTPFENCLHSSYLNQYSVHLYNKQPINTNLPCAATSKRKHKCWKWDSQQHNWKSRGTTRTNCQNGKQRHNFIYTSQQYPSTSHPCKLCPSWNASILHGFRYWIAGRWARIIPQNHVVGACPFSGCAVAGRQSTKECFTCQRFVITSFNNACLITSQAVF